MTTEEKARAYDEALKRARKIHSEIVNNELLGFPGQIEDIFPQLREQLREDDDEKIRKGLIEALKASKTVGELKFVLPYPTREECIAYLEKQKEASKAIEAVDRIDKYIDEHLANAHDMKDSNPDKKYYRGWDDALGKMAGILQDVYSEKENKFAPRVLPCSAAWFEDGEEKQKEQKPAEWSEEDSNMLHDIEGYVTGTGSSSGITKEERSKWLWSLPKRFNPQPKQEWSEEDEEMVQFYLDYADYKLGGWPNTKVVEMREKFRNWLEALPKRLQLKPSWKPSEEQMEALKCAIEDVAKFSRRAGCQVELENEPYYSALHSLYCNLEKLI